MEKIREVLGRYYRHYEFTTGINVMEPWEQRMVHTFTAGLLAISVFSTVHYLPHYLYKLSELFF